MKINDWNDREVEVATSRGGTKAVADFNHNLLTPTGIVWPPGPILQKLYKSRHVGAFDGENASVVVRNLGYYCDLQSLHSEDAATWSLFGPVASLAAERRAVFFNSMLAKLGLPGENNLCDVDLFRRIPHPDTLVPGGPEIDFLLIGDKCVLLGEAKWRSSIGRLQGVARDKDQIQLRCEFLAKYGRSLFGDRQTAVILVNRLQENLSVENSHGIPVKQLRWTDLVAIDEHPASEELQRYMKWKELHSRD